MTIAKRGALTAEPRLRFPEFQKAAAWAVKPMNGLYSFMRNNTLSRAKLNYEKGSAKNIHYGDIHTKFSALFDITKEDVPYVNSTEEVPSIGAEDYCVEGDLIFADASEDISDVGKSIEIIDLAGEQLLSGQHTILARRKDNNTLAVGFGGHLFHSRLIRSRIEKEAQGTKVYQISSSRLSRIDITYPDDKDEQQKIADCLTSLDELIAAQGQKVAALKTHKRGLMQQLFPREGEIRPGLRFPEFRNAPKWELKRLNEVSPSIFDGTHQTPTYTAEGVPFYSVENLISGSLNKFISREDYLIATKKNKPEKGDVLFTRIGKIGHSRVVTWGSEFSVYVTLAVIKSSPKIDSHFLHYTIQSEVFQAEVRGKSLNSAVPPKINMDSLRSTQLLITELPEQKRIADCFSYLDTRIDSESDQLATLKTHKQGLMQQLFPAPEDIGA